VGCRRPRSDPEHAERRSGDYGGEPLYLYSNEGLAETASGFATAVSGNGIVLGGGTFSLINA